MPRISGKLVKKELVAKETFLIGVQIEKYFPIRAGSIFAFKVADKVYRSYSLVYNLNLEESEDQIQLAVQNPPFTKPELENFENGALLYFLIACKGQGVGANYISNLAINESLELIGPSGKFALVDDFDQNKNVLIGTGTGLAPFVMMTWESFNKGLTHNFEIMAGLNGYDGNWIKDLLPHEINLKTCFYPAKDKYYTNEFEGFVTDFVKPEKNKIYYLCGHPNMVQNVEEKLLDSQSDIRIVKEKFSL
jgi:NAD(P)H-flavin reductase